MAKVKTGSGMPITTYVERVAGWAVAQKPHVLYTVDTLAEVCLAMGWDPELVASKVTLRIIELHPEAHEAASEWDGISSITQLAMEAGVHQHLIFWAASPAKRNRYFNG